VIEYAVPLGKRAVIRSVIASNPGGSTGLVQVLCAEGLVLHHRFQAAEGTRTLDVRAVAYQGEELQVYTSVEGMHCAVHGYLFVDESSETAAPPGSATKPGPELPVDLGEAAEPR